MLPFDLIINAVDLLCRDEIVNDGTTLYVTGLSTRVTERDLEDHFSKEGKVKSLLDLLLFFDSFTCRLK